MMPDAPLRPDALLSEGELTGAVPLNCELPICAVETEPVDAAGWRTVPGGK
jgi:hypothetical protein